MGFIRRIEVEEKTVKTVPGIQIDLTCEDAKHLHQILNDITPSQYSSKWDKSNGRFHCRLWQALKASRDRGDF